MEEHPNPQVKWKNMRRMAWSALIGGLAYPAGVYVAGGEHLVSIAMPFYLFVSAVVGAYMGFSSWGDKR